MSTASGQPTPPLAQTPASPPPADARDQPLVRPDPSPVPFRAILATIGLLLVTAAFLYVLLETRQVLVWIIVAAFFAIALAPVVGWVQRHAFGQRRALATLAVFVLVVVALAGLATLFIVPLASEGRSLASQLPPLIEKTRQGKGPVGDLLQRTNALDYVQTHQAQIKSFAAGLTTPAAGILRSLATGIAGLVTIFVLAYLMVLEGPKIVDGTLALFSRSRATRIRHVADDCARSITGYISGNLLISIICGILTYIVLKVLGVPFAGLVAVFVAIVDLIPLVGATIGAVVATIDGFIHSVPAGIAVIVFFVIYQQLENHLLQPMIYARTVKLNPLTVIIAILVSVELAGILGALLAIPIASMIQVIARDVWDHRTGQPKSQPTVGVDQHQVNSAADDHPSVPAAKTPVL